MWLPWSRVSYLLQTVCLQVFCLRLDYLCGNHLCLVGSSKLLSRLCPTQHKGVCSTTGGALTLRSGLRNYRAPRLEGRERSALGYVIIVNDSNSENCFFFIWKKHLFCVIESCLWVIPCGPKKPCKKSVAYCLIWNSFWWIIIFMIEEKKIKICFVMCKLLEIRKKQRKLFHLSKGQHLLFW